ncbi:uncharacterized protein LOC126587381 [Malus sylvestris]|uniref:uncharacterized protein LOC126587381 n=1 Tax=Malus sylvestris TaxID=3752 RepID=UPI0021ABEB83|nr:uncharacterized protein LOC126587381 [Malus sylvestris]
MGLYTGLANINLQVPTPGFELCLMLIWALRKHRNDVLWNGSLLPPHEIVLRTEGWMQEYHKWHKPAAKRSIREVQKWRKPEEGWIKCNFDGAWSQSGLRGGFGVVIRNHLGEFITAVVG